MTGGLSGQVDLTEKVRVLVRENLYEDCEIQALNNRTKLIAEEAGKTDILLRARINCGCYERKLQAIKLECSQWKSKYEELAERYAELQGELLDLQAVVNSF